VATVDEELDEDLVLVAVAGRRYLARGRGDAWRLYELDAHGAVTDSHTPSAHALTAAAAWARGVPGAADLPADELVIVEADQRGGTGHRLLSASCPPELAEG
jgi:hypothetical protein